MKSEEGEYSIHDLHRDRKAPWFGVRNYQARNYMRDEMHVGDLVIFYHSNGNPSASVGIAKVASTPYPDETQFDTSSHYYYPKATQESPVWMLVDVSFVEIFSTPVSIDEMRKTKTLKDMIMLKKGSRLSVTPLTKKEFNCLERLGSRDQKK